MGQHIAAAILAGGDGRRMGGESKALLSLGSHRLIDLVYEALKPQTGSCALCLRTHKPWADALQLPILTDRPSSDRGPLGGIAAALAWGLQSHRRPTGL